MRLFLQKIFLHEQKNDWQSFCGRFESVKISIKEPNFLIEKKPTLTKGGNPCKSWTQRNTPLTSSTSPYTVYSTGWKHRVAQLVSVNVNQQPTHCIYTATITTVKLKTRISELYHHVSVGNYKAFREVINLQPLSSVLHYSLLIYILRLVIKDVSTLEPW